jgi:adenine/guanine phosphoribosyltransferase-like PRPP-binding protein
MYGAAAGLPPTLARFEDSTPSAINDYPSILNYYFIVTLYNNKDILSNYNRVAIVDNILLY